jgi:RimJ/RimL family protein N-acetyltransferase
MEFARTRDLTLVRSVLTHASQVRMSAEDATDVATWNPHDDERIWYIAARELDEVLGIFTLIPQNACCYEIHAALLPRCWGARTREALRGALAWMFANSPARRIVASIPAYNRLAIALARDAGLTRYGMNEKSFMRGGTLHDQVLVGISKP